MSEILFMNPVFSHTIWGGDKLRTKYGFDEPGNDIGECWAIAAHPSGDGTIAEGSYAGEKLSAVYRNHPELFQTGDVTTAPADRFPLLIKIIDAKDDLSIQVHPDDAYAGVHENGSLGKTECWYILDCKENATIVVGHNAGTREELSEMIDEGRFEDLIRELPIRPGDFIQIDPGTVHAIKGGTTILETQQSSDITYRLYDYGRLQNGKPRPLHLQQSKDVITVPAASAAESILHDTDSMDVTGVKELKTCPFYSVYRVNVAGSLALDVEKPYVLMTVCRGEGSVNGHALHMGDSFILPSGLGRVALDGNMQILASSEKPVPALEKLA